MNLSLDVHIEAKNLDLLIKAIDTLAFDMRQQMPDSEEDLRHFTESDATEGWTYTAKGNYDPETSRSPDPKK